MEIVAKRITELRMGLGLSQSKMAKALGISQSGLNRYEHNQVGISDDVLLKYADFFDLSADYILGRTDKPEGKLYKHEPEAIKRKMVREDEWEAFVEACFDPRSPMNKRLKALILTMAGGDGDR